MTGCRAPLAACASLILATPGFAQVVRVPSAQWTAELIEDLDLGLQSLPPAARAFPGGPLEVELHEEESPLGLGDAVHPAFTGGLARLHLYAFKEAGDARAAAPLARLTPGERRRLWRRRAIVHAVIRRWDDRLRWSARAGWVRLSGWEGGRPWLDYPGAFSRREGMSSAALDLATFAEELLVPAESMSARAVAADEQVRCRALSKSRFLDQRLTGLDPSWQPARACPHFDAWADPEHVAGFEVTFTAPSTGGAQALFGHLLVTVVRDGTQPEGNEQVMELAALVAPSEAGGFSYLARGVTGGFEGIFAVSRLADVQHEALELEQRNVRRFRLELDAPQREQLLERMWDLERVGYVGYRFFGANCASMLRFLLAPALGDAAPGGPLSPWDTPLQLLDALGPRLAVPEIDESTGQRAQRVRPERRRLLETASLATRAALEPQWRQLEALDGAAPRDRAAVYARLAAAELPPGEARWRARVLLASLRIERHALDAANLARLQAERATVLPGWKGPTSAELVAARQQRFEQQLHPERRARKELGEQLALDALLQSAPRRAFTEAERQTLAEEAVARETFDAVAGAVGGLPEAELSAVLEEERQARRSGLAAANARSVPESGYGRGGVGAGLTSAGVGLLRLRAALLAEELGDQRLHGFGPRTELRVLEGALDLARRPSGVVERGTLTLVSARGLRESGWGWGGGLDYGFDAGTHEVAAAVERLWAVLEDERLTNFLLASAGVRAGVRVDDAARAAIYPRVGLSSRLQLPGSFGNAVRLEAGYAPRLSLGAGVKFEHVVNARAQLAVRLGAAAGVAFTARAAIEATWTSGQPIAAVGSVGVELE